jgi:hypothetical protein
MICTQKKCTVYAVVYACLDSPYAAFGMNFLCAVDCVSLCIAKGFVHGKYEYIQNFCISV